MKSTGIVRKVDELGRIVIPIELRRVLSIGIKDSLEIFVEDEKIIFRKYEPACLFCETADRIIEFTNLPSTTAFISLCRNNSISRTLPRR